MKKTKWFIGGVMGLWLQTAAAAMPDYTPAFRIDWDNDKLPSLAELQNYFYKVNTVYDTHYESVFDLTGKFDREFYQTISTYGMSERRLKPDNEETMLEMLKNLPRSQYEYIGPMLFRVPGMSEKVLNLDGIRETKNRFPSRVAEELKNIKDLEFLSPELYFILNPEVWQQVKVVIDEPLLTPMPVKTRYNPRFYQMVKTLVPPENYQRGKTKPQKITRSDMRTVNAKPDDLLTAADAAAFTRTIDGVQNWLRQGDNLLQIYNVTTMWNAYEQAYPNEKSLPLPHLKDLVNPCQRLVQKAMILGREMELAQVVVSEGFSLQEWGYTCDKALKAYRASYMSLDLIADLNSYRRGGNAKQMERLSPYTRDVRYATMQAISEMYRAPLSDVLEVRKKRRQMHDKLAEHGFEVFAVTGIGRMD